MTSINEARDYAENTLGLEVPEDATLTDIQALIDGKRTPKKTTRKATPTVIRSKKTTPKKDRYKIILHSSGKNKRAQPVSVNGYTYLIPRDVPVEVPIEVIGVLETRIETTLDLDTGEETDSLRFPFSRV